MADESPLGGPLELPGGEQRGPRTPSKSGRDRGLIKKLLVIIGIIVIMAGIGYGAGKLLTHGKTNKSASGESTPKSSESLPNSSKNTDVPKASGTKSYKSTQLGIELAYPTDWTINETNGGIRVESSEFNYTTANQGSVTGNFRVYIRKGARPIDDKYIGQGVAIMPSEKITYTAPASTQRKDTNLSFFGLNTPDQFAFFLVAGNFNLNKGDTLGPSYGKEPDTVLVTGGYSSKTLTDDFATNQVPLDSFQQTNAYKQAIDILKSLKLQ